MNSPKTKLFTKEVLIVDGWCKEHQYDEGFIELPKHIAVQATYVVEALDPGSTRSRSFSNLVRTNIEREISTLLLLPDGDEKYERGLYIELDNVERDLMFYYDPFSQIPQNYTLEDHR